MSKAYADGQEGRIDGYNEDMAAYKKQLDQNRRTMSDFPLWIIVNSTERVFIRNERAYKRLMKKLGW